jgi:hypothetical protein
MEPAMTDLNTRLCERLRAMEVCPVCGARRKEFRDSTDTRLAIAVFDCGADVVLCGAMFITALGCKHAVADALALIKADEQAKP